MGKTPRVGLRGFSLINLLLTIAIMAIVLAIGVPSLNAMVKTSKMASQYNQVLAFVSMARQYAITYRSFVTVCPSSNAKACNRDWSSGMMSFVDHDRDRKLDSEDFFIKYLPITDDDILVTWRSFRSNNFFRFAQSGWTDHYNGTFRFCFDDSDLRFNRALIIGKPGRARSSYDSDGDNIHEDRKGNDVRCD